jgi:O-antigen ligase
MPFIDKLQRITLYIFFISINFEIFVPFNAIGLSFSRLTGILYLISIIPEIKLFVRTDRLSSILLLALMFFSLLTFVSLLHFNVDSSNFFDITIFQNILLFWFLVNHARKDFLILEKGMLLFAFGTIVMAIFYIVGIGVEYEGGRLSMFQENENALGLNMSLGILILFMSVIQNKLQLSRLRFLFLIPIPLMVNFVFETGSRLAFLSFLLSIIAGIVLLKTQKSSVKLIVITIGAVFLAVIGVWLIQHEVLRDRLFKSVQEGDLGGRSEIWKNLLPLIKENPIFGVGSTGYASYTLTTFGGEESPHNVIIEVICLTGIAGLLIYLLMLYKILLKAYYNYRINGLLLPILMTIPVLGTIFSGQILTRKIGWIILAYIVGSTAIKAKSMKKNAVINPFRNENPLCN